LEGCEVIGVLPEDVRYLAQQIFDAVETLVEVLEQTRVTITQFILSHSGKALTEPPVGAYDLFSRLTDILRFCFAAFLPILICSDGLGDEEGEAGSIRTDNILTEFEFHAFILIGEGLT
jgi:hypothetical protein